MEFIHSYDRDVPLKGQLPYYRLKPTGCDLRTYDKISIPPHLNLLGQYISLVGPTINKHGSRSREPLDLDVLLLSNSIQRYDDKADTTSTKQ